jgi:GTP-sensing pleiotropic transcriptional regulator CodY
VADHLTEAEGLCQKTLQVLESQTSFPSEKIEVMRKSLKGLLPIIAESKRKVMVRSARGQKITQEILDNASKLYDVVSLRSSEGKAVDEVVNRLEGVEGSVKKLQIYWKSFEYVTT